MANDEGIPQSVKTRSAGEAYYLADRLYGRSVSALLDEKPEVRRDMCMASRVIRALLHDLAGVAMPFTCPHGRPVLLHIALADIEKKFLRC